MNVFSHVYNWVGGQAEGSQHGRTAERTHPTHATHPIHQTHQTHQTHKTHPTHTTHQTHKTHPTHTTHPTYSTYPTHQTHPPTSYYTNAAATAPSQYQYHSPPPPPPIPTSTKPVFTSPHQHHSTQYLPSTSPPTGAIPGSFPQPTAQFYPRSSTPTASIPAQSFPHQIVTFTVGPDSDKKKFSVKAQYLSRYSTTIRSALSHPSISEQVLHYRLPEMTTDVFRMFIQWLGNQRIDNIHGIEVALFKEFYPCEDEIKEICEQEDVSLVHLYLFGGKFCIPKLQEYVIQLMYRKQQYCGPMGTECYPIIYERTSRGSGLRRFAVDQQCCVLAFDKENLAMEDEGWLPREMLLDIVFLLRGQMSMDEKRQRAADMSVQKYY